MNDKIERKKILKELFNNGGLDIIDKISNEKDLLDNKKILPEDLWQTILEILELSFSKLPEEWEKSLLEEKKKILCFKYFTKTSLIDVDNLEKDIREKIRPYFSSLEGYLDEENFKERFFNLPKDILFSFVRYIFHNSKELNEKIVVSKEDFKELIGEMKENRMKIIKKISFISNGNVTTINMTLIKDLVDSGIFYEDNYLNRGVMEYLFKLCTHDISKERLIDSFNNTFVKDLKRTIERCKSYICHVNDIKNEITPEFFNDNGAQEGRRYDIEIENVQNNNLGDYVVDKKSIFKEPNAKISNSEFSWENGNNENLGGEDNKKNKNKKSNNIGNSGGGGGFSGGGGGGGFSDTFNMPNEETGGSNTEGTSGETSEELPQGETPMPEDENGLPVAFGSQEDNGLKEPKDEENNEEK